MYKRQADVLTGAANWAFATIIIKPILVLFFTNKSDKIINVRNVFAAIIAGIVGTVLDVYKRQEQRIRFLRNLLL